MTSATIVINSDTGKFRGSDGLTTRIQSNVCVLLMTIGPEIVLMANLRTSITEEVEDGTLSNVTITIAMIEEEVIEVVVVAI